MNKINSDKIKDEIEDILYRYNISEKKTTTSCQDIQKTIAWKIVYNIAHILDGYIHNAMEEERKEILQIVLEDVPHQYQNRLIKKLK